MNKKLEELLEQNSIDVLSFNNRVHELNLPNLKSLGIDDETIYMLRVNYLFRILMYNSNIYNTEIYLLLSDDVTVDIWESRLPAIVTFFVEQQLL